MTNTLTISRELAERLDSPHSFVRNAAREALRKILAASAVERQPIQSWPCWSCKAPVTMANRADADGDCPHCEAELDLEDWPPAPVAVDERAEFDAWTVRKGRVVGYSGWREDFAIWQARACLDKVKEMNR